MTLADVLAKLEPVQQHAVDLVYFKGHTCAEAARVLAVERVVILAALTVAFRRIARWAADGT